MPYNLPWLSNTSVGSGLAQDDPTQWNSAQAAYLNPIISNLDGSNPIVVDAGAGATHTDLTNAINDGTARPVKVIGDIDISSGSGPDGSTYRPKTSGASKVIYCSPLNSGRLIGTKCFEMDTGTYLVGIRLACIAGRTLRPRAGASLRDYGAIGCSFEANAYHYREEPGEGVIRADVQFRWNRFTAPASGSDLFFFSSARAQVTDNWFASGGTAIRRILRYGGYGGNFSRNVIEDGFTGITFLAQNGATGSSSQYNFPSFQSPVGDYINGNYIKGILEESISYDCQGNSVAGHSCIGMGTVLAKAGTGSSSPQITFNTKTNGTTNDGIGGASGVGTAGTDNTLYYRNPIGKWIMFVDGTMAGKVAQIADIAVSSAGVGVITMTAPGSTSALQGLRSTADALQTSRRGILTGELTAENFTSLATGSKYWIGDLAYDNEISDNVIEVVGVTNRNSTGIALWGMASDLRVIRNRLVDMGTEASNLSKTGIALSHVTGVSRKNDCHTLIVGGTEVGQFHLANVTVADNDMGGLKLLARNAAYAAMANQFTQTMPWVCARNRRCLNGAPTVDNWIGTDGTYSGPIPSFATDSASVYGNT